MIVKAKQAATEEMAVASGVNHLMYAGSHIISSRIFDEEDVSIQDHWYRGFKDRMNRETEEMQWRTLF